jgi:hypothetical protein
MDQDTADRIVYEALEAARRSCALEPPTPRRRAQRAWVALGAVQPRDRSPRDGRAPVEALEKRRSRASPT